ncbi:carbohydrate ABC transporter permease [Actinopolymorpha rutila]|uniref:ABC-type sugar transport system permease subunit n=1 Tax=Actinopolymorpha rutila TaxID=446787 RepID=A0A852Z7K2_9ACTN|nr:sugar ABC transporter permease [Actinopolymorpha rutila]NYH87842.1 ABC-type sugar transport system permease subunit [Actinopolymorpha rutila]
MRAIFDPSYGLLKALLTPLGVTSPAWMTDSAWGAGAWTLFRRLTLPLLSPVTFFIAITSVIGTFQAFDIIAIMTGGGPGDATTTLSW